MDDTIIPGMADDPVSHARQRVGQLYRCRSILTNQDMTNTYKTWIRPILEYVSILYSGAAATHLNCLDYLQS